MKKIALVVLSAAMLIGYDAQAAQQGLFGGRAPQDGSLDMRQSTTEQFNPIRGQSVAARPRPDFDPTPIALGSFQAFPSINAASYYDSNIYSNTAAKNDDVVWKINPALGVASNWGRHALAFTGVGDASFFTNNADENYVGGAAQLEGRYDVAAQTWIAPYLAYQRNTEPRASADVVGNARTPTQFDLLRSGIGVNRGQGALKAQAKYDFSYYDYDKLRLVGGGSLSLNQRNRTQQRVSGDLQYDVTENLKPFVRGGYEWRDYTSNSRRTSGGYNIDAGVKADFGGIVTAEAYAGYIARDYDNFASGNVGAVDFGGDVLWNVTELTSIAVDASRSIDETTFGGFSAATASNAVLSTGTSATVTHELRRDVILEASGTYTNNDFQNSVREDDVYGAGAGGRYFFNRNFYGDLNYNFIKRDSNNAGSSYDRHIVLARVGAQY